MEVSNKIIVESKDFSPILALLFFLIIILFSSCDKDTFKSDEVLLSTNSWRLQSIISEPPFVLSDGTVITDMYDLEPDCALDNSITYTEEGTYYRSEGANVCSWSEPISEPGTWRFITVDGDKMIEYDHEEPAGIRYSIKMKSITGDQLVLIFKGGSRIETLTYNNVQLND